jgi:hypothetical protein
MYACVGLHRMLNMAFPNEATRLETVRKMSGWYRSRFGVGKYASGSIAARSNHCCSRPRKALALDKAMGQEKRRVNRASAGHDTGEKADAPRPAAPDAKGAAAIAGAPAIGAPGSSR